MEYSAIFLILLVLTFGICAIHESNVRHKWLHEHCKVIGKLTGDLIPAPQGIAIESDKTGWLCDDGLQYWES